MIVFLQLIFEFFKTGLFAVGGGLATLPFLYDIASKYDWLDVSVMPDMIAVSESTPGPIGVNMATYCGYNAGFEVGGVAGGLLGGILATLALILPSFIIAMLVSKILQKFKSSTLVENSFKGLRPAVCGLIGAAALNVFTAACINSDILSSGANFLKALDIKALVLFAVIFVVNKKIKVHPIFLIIPAAVVGIIFKM